MDLLTWWQTLPSKMDPVLVSIGPVTIYWYSTMYLVAFGVVYLLCRKKIKSNSFTKINLEQLEDLLSWCFIGLLIGARIGYVLFYNPEFYLNSPIRILYLWEGGMSFHGGFLGVIVAAFVFASRNNIHTLYLADMLACVAPIGLFFGRIANFINSELYGRVTDAPWGIIFPNGGSLPRHPSQLYEAFLEGLVLFIVLITANYMTKARFFPGTLLGLFLLGYGIFRSFVELFREPDSHIGFIFNNITMGQILSVPMIFIGILFLYMAFNYKNREF